MTESSWGGKRTGSGRPKGSGKFGKPTKAIRVPEDMINSIKRFIAYQEYQIPFYGAKVAAGFPSPADDYLETSLDLNEYLIQHPAATFFVRATGDSMINAGIFPNDILIVDRSLEPTNGKIIIAAINGELTVKRLIKQKSRIILQPENKAYQPIPIPEETELQIWGVVTNVIHSV